jgi:hypothetical protein
MYALQQLDLSWGAQLTLVRLALLSQAALVLISLVRFVQSGRRLYRYSGERILPEHVLRAEADPDLLAAYALARRLPCKAVDKRANSELPRNPASTDKVLLILRAAESRFLYLWENCYADVESAKRASLLSFLLAVVMVTYAALPTFSRYVLNKGAYPLLAAEHLLVLFTLGCSCCTLLYLASSFFERKLVNRKICWKYFCSRLRDELSRE